MSDMVNARTGTGAGIGAAIGFFIGGGPIGAAIGGVIGGAIAHTTGKTKGVMTTRRKLIYTRAMESIKDPADLKALADSFAGEGLSAEAEMLRKRAALRELPAEVAEQRRIIFRRAMASDNAAGIRELAGQFASVGAIDAAKMLQIHATAVEAAKAAGGTATPVDMRTLSGFADKLAKAIGHFGPDSKQVMSAARNLILAQGKIASKEAVEELIAVAQGTLEQDAAERQEAAPSAAAEVVDSEPPAAPKASVAQKTIDVPAQEDEPAKVRVDVDETAEPPLQAARAN